MSVNISQLGCRASLCTIQEARSSSGERWQVWQQVSRLRKSFQKEKETMKPKFTLRLKSSFWALLLAALPFTSFPLLAQLVGGSSVAPLSAVFLLVLAVFFYLPS